MSFTQSIAINPSVVVYDDRGSAWLRKGDAARALADFEAALKISPRRASSLYGRGLARRAGGDVKGADADIADAIRLQPNVATTMPLLATKP